HRLFGLQDMQAHHIGSRVVEHDAEEVELQHLPQALRQFVEERGQVAVARERLESRQQGLVVLDAVGAAILWSPAHALGGTWRWSVRGGAKPQYLALYALRPPSAQARLTAAGMGVTLLADRIAEATVHRNKATFGIRT